MNIYGIGTDIVECLRIAQLIERHGDRFINRIFTPTEVRICTQSKNTTQQFASHWVAKEAILKAMRLNTVKQINFRDIEVRPGENGKQVVAMQATAKELLEQSGISEILISTSHCRTHATAYAIALAKNDSNSF